ncbi:hypothetical protein [Pedobacter sp. B4-66]|uniref:hypothetical protein n=1 Tax=Pedobacter sp. B4-66 TaxID=2817280 RepID=UPI001BDAA42B|nr:hypothetical protein [Pedobacter sp. B4-66]
MKTLLPLFGLLLLLSACDDTKIQLRAPQSQVTETKADSVAVIVKDSIKTDSTKVLIKK